MNQIKRHRATLVLLALVFVGTQAAAQGYPKFEISAGFFPMNFSTDAKLDTEENEGSDVNLEDDLGLRSKLQNFRIEGTWRFRPRHSVEFGYTSWKRDGDKDIDFPIDWGDKHFDVGGNVSVENNAQFIKLAYRWSFYQTPTTEIAASFGVDTVWNETTLEGEGTVRNDAGQEVSGFYSETYDFVAPAPVLGLSARQIVAEKFLVRGSAEYFQATIDETTGKILDLRGSGEWLLSDRYSAGLGYSWVGYAVERPRFDASYDFSGPIIYFTYRR